MIRTLLVQGMVAGVLAGLLAFGFAKVFGEPQVDRAIAFEEHMHHAAANNHADSDHAASDEHEEELVPRAIQKSIGLFTGVVVYGVAFGGLFALVFAYAYGRIGALSPRATSLLLAALAFLALVIVPGLKYPANPPAVGDPNTISLRTGLFLVMLLGSVLSVVIALWVARKTAARLGSWNARYLGVGVFLVIVILLQVVLPAVDEVPADFPASTLWRFRIASLGLEALLWTSIGVIFGEFAERTLGRAAVA